MTTYSTFITVWILVSISEVICAEFHTQPFQKRTNPLTKAIVGLKVGSWLGFMWMVFTVLGFIYDVVSGAFA